ncbi:hypothetical protein CHUAL_012228 [Chamberlinius hualienensis]
MVIWTTFPPPTEGLKVSLSNVAVNIEKKDSGRGTLYISESRVSWVGDNGRGFSLEYPAISLHAISKDLSAFPHECLYLMLNVKFEDLANELTQQSEVNKEEEDEEDLDLDDITEVRFIPDDKSSLETLFQAMNECQALHPDPQDAEDDEEEEDEEEGYEAGGEYYDEEIQPGRGGHGDGRFGNGSEPMDIGQFDDAEEEQ